MERSQETLPSMLHTVFWHIQLTKIKIVVPTTTQQNQSLHSELMVNGGQTDYIDIS